MYCCFFLSEILSQRRIHWLLRLLVWRRFDYHFPPKFIRQQIYESVDFLIQSERGANQFEIISYVFINFPGTFSFSANQQSTNRPLTYCIFSIDIDILPANLDQWRCALESGCHSSSHRADDKTFSVRLHRLWVTLDNVGSIGNFLWNRLQMVSMRSQFRRNVIYLWEYFVILGPSILHQKRFRFDDSMSSQRWRVGPRILQMNGETIKGIPNRISGSFSTSRKCRK